MSPAVIRSRFSGPSGALVKQRRVNFTLFTFCVSSGAFREGVGGGVRFRQGGQFHSRHHSDSPAEAQREEKFMSCCLHLILISLGSPRRLLTTGAFWISFSENSVPATSPPAHRRTNHTDLCTQKILISIQALQTCLSRVPKWL